jgi:demethylmenaquinone methyltransferase/2-methoxy-6-polyprenyl-1,4-benzoquinol methylase
MPYASKLYDLLTSRFYDKQMDLELVHKARRLVVSSIKVGPGARVLEVGCGSGLNQPLLIEALGETGQIVALDASIEMLNQAKVRAQEQGYADRMVFIHGDARKLDLLLRDAGEDDEFDALFLTLILTVVPDWRRVFENAYEHLKVGGRCGIMDSYWSKSSITHWLVRSLYAADSKRPTFVPLREIAAEYQVAFLPPAPQDSFFFVASGTKK